ncbi:hypothetical protein CRG98_027946 [Punica granatum]|uniref:Uncharacterized protein n=1 Tax=Punica granatum TaxID=22663 RepID=A0A2I0J5Z9_PUNGR|nr:hypothetical protein CRG98_027946 [Punica granatum]
MKGQSPKAVNVRPKPNIGLKPNAVNAGPEPNAVNAEPEPDAGSKPNAVNARPEPDAVNAGPEPNAVNACSIRKCKKCKNKGLVARMDSASVHNASRYREVKTAGSLPEKVGTTCLSCGVGGRDGRPLVIARLTMES